MILIIDNYDSFTYNIVQYVGRFYPDIEVFRNDKITSEEISKRNPRAVIISPGPKTPDQAGISKQVILNFYKKIPILGVCLGHQAIGQVFGGKIIRAPEIMHGKISTVTHDSKGIFKKVKNPLKVVRYHSLIIQKESNPDCMDISSKSENDIIMAVRHKKYPSLEGIQFHPESIKTEIALFLNRNLIRKVPLFQKASRAFITEIALNLKPHVFIPGDFIIREGKIGTHMFFINQGHVEVVGPDDKTVFATLSPGSFFGEIALLESARRNASIRAIDYCDIYSLDKDTFDNVLNDYPDFAKHVKEESKKRLVNNK